LRRTVGGVCLFGCACLLWAGPTLAAGGPTQDSGVVDQYTEQVPTAGGPHGTHSGGGPGTGGTTGSSGGSIVLPASVDKEGGKDAKTLRDVATSPRYGAPNATVPLPDSSMKSSAALSSAVNAASDGSDGRMVGLFVALLALTAVSIGVAAARRRP
jgi:hypothetical protein